MIACILRTSCFCEIWTLCVLCRGSLMSNGCIWITKLVFRLFPKKNLNENNALIQIPFFFLILRLLALGVTKCWVSSSREKAKVQTCYRKSFASKRKKCVKKRNQTILLRFRLNYSEELKFHGKAKTYVCLRIKNYLLSVLVLNLMWYRQVSPSGSNLIEYSKKSKLWNQTFFKT